MEGFGRSRFESMPVGWMRETKMGCGKVGYLEVILELRYVNVYTILCRGSCLVHIDILEIPSYEQRSPQ